MRVQLGVKLTDEEYHLRQLERLMGEGNCQAASFALDLYGFRFETNLDQKQSERLAAIKATMEEQGLRSPGETWAPSISGRC